MILDNLIVNNLESTSANQPLSAEQGNELKQLINPLRGGLTIVTSFNANDYTGTFALSIGDTAGWSNLPTFSHGVFSCRNACDYIIQRYDTYKVSYKRISHTRGATWGDWISDAGSCIELLAANVSNTEKVYTIDNMSKYGTLYFAISYLELVRGGITIPYELFKKFGKVNNTYVLGGPTYEYLVRRISDTEIAVSTTFADGILPFVVYGY